MKKFFTFCLAISMVMGTASLLLFSVQQATATPSANPVNIPAAPRSASMGDIMMDYSSVHVPSQDKTYYEVLAWDIKTGKSLLYYYNYSDKKWKAYSENAQLPNYMDGVRFNGGGDIMMDYTSVHVPSADKTYYEVLIWDTQSGENDLFYYNYSEKAWVSYSETAQLPFWKDGIEF